MLKLESNCLIKNYRKFKCNKLMLKYYLLIFQTIDALEDSNKYIKDMQNLMQKKDWQGILDDAKNKYELDWP